MKPVWIVFAAMIVAAQFPVFAAEPEALGIFARLEPDKTTLIKLVCARRPGQLDCQFAATQIGKSAKAGECYIAMNAYPVSLKAKGNGRWLGTKSVPHCPTGRTDYRLELDEKDKSSLARLVIEGCRNEPPSVFFYDAKSIKWNPGCQDIATMNHPQTISQIGKSD